MFTFRDGLQHAFFCWAQQVGDDFPSLRAGTEVTVFLGSTLKRDVIHNGDMVFMFRRRKLVMVCRVFGMAPYQPNLKYPGYSVAAVLARVMPFNVPLDVDAEPWGDYGDDMVEAVEICVAFPPPASGVAWICDYCAGNALLIAVCGTQNARELSVFEDTSQAGKAWIDRVCQNVSQSIKAGKLDDHDGDDVYWDELPESMASPIRMRYPQMAEA